MTGAWSLPARPARHPVLLINPRSGGGKAERFHLVDHCRARGIEPVVLEPDADLRGLVEKAVADGADVVGMAGGDGSQGVVASVAARHGIAVVVVPSGTRNHFAMDLGLDRRHVDAALDAFGDALQGRIDLAEVNGRVFVNNASLGLYAEIVRSPGYREAKVETALATLSRLLAPGSRPFELRFTGPAGRTSSAWPGATAPRASSRAWRPGTASPWWSCRRAPGTTSPWTSGSTGGTSMPRWTPSATPSRGASIWPR